MRRNGDQKVEPALTLIELQVSRNCIDLIDLMVGKVSNLAFLKQLLYLVTHLFSGDGHWLWLWCIDAELNIFPQISISQKTIDQHGRFVRSWRAFERSSRD